MLAFENIPGSNTSFGKTMNFGISELFLLQIMLFVKISNYLKLITAKRFKKHDIQIEKYFLTFCEHIYVLS